MQALQSKTARVAQTSQRSAAPLVALPAGNVAVRIVPFQVLICTSRSTASCVSAKILTPEGNDCTLSLYMQAATAAQRVHVQGEPKHLNHEQILHVTGGLSVNLI